MPVKYNYEFFQNSDVFITGFANAVADSMRHAVLHATSEIAEDMKDREEKRLQIVEKIASVSNAIETLSSVLPAGQIDQLTKSLSVLKAEYADTQVDNRRAAAMSLVKDKFAKHMKLKGFKTSTLTLHKLVDVMVRAYAENTPDSEE